MEPGWQDDLRDLFFDEALRIGERQGTFFVNMRPPANDDDVDEAEDFIGRPITPIAKRVFTELSADLGVEEDDGETRSLSADISDMASEVVQSERDLAHGWVRIDNRPGALPAYVALNMNTKPEWDVWLLRRDGGAPIRLASNLHEYLLLAHACGFPGNPLDLAAFVEGDRLVPPTQPRTSHETTLARPWLGWLRQWDRVARRMHVFGKDVNLAVHAPTDEELMQSVVDARDGAPLPPSLQRLAREFSSEFWFNWGRWRRHDDTGKSWDLPGGRVPESMRRTEPEGNLKWNVSYDGRALAPPRWYQDDYFMTHEIGDGSETPSVVVLFDLESPEWEVWGATEDGLGMRLAGSLHDWYALRTEFGGLDNAAYYLAMAQLEGEHAVDLGGETARTWRRLLEL